MKSFNLENLSTQWINKYSSEGRGEGMGVYDSPSPSPPPSLVLDQVRMSSYLEI